MNGAPSDSGNSASTSETQLSIALQRIRDEARSVDPQSCVARFGSAF